ncbi:MAG: hypothetical protein AAB608_01590 [Patescibacteria group bacterium]
MKVIRIATPYEVKLRAAEVLQTYLEFTGAVLHSDREMRPRECGAPGTGKVPVSIPELVYQSLRIVDGPFYRGTGFESLGFKSFSEFHAAVQRHIYKLPPAEQERAVAMQLIATRR